MLTVFLKSVLSLAVFICFAFSGKGQWFDPSKVNRKASALNEKAYEAALEGKYPESIALLNEALKADAKFVDAILSRAGIYANMRDYSASVSDFRKAFELDSVYASTYLLPYSISLAGTGLFSEALVKVNAFLQTPGLNEQSVRAGNYRKGTYEFALRFKEKNKGKDYIFNPVNLSESINTADLEYFPSLTIDGKKMIFTRRIKNDEDFFESDYINNSWSKAVPLAGRINTNLNEGAQNISQDGELLIFTGCNYPEGKGSCDLYISSKTKNGAWSEPENMRINTEHWESSPSISPDKRELYFASKAPGGYGGSDIWVTTREADGKWGIPQNLGPEINTSGDEGCPFIHPDNQTLYFNSNGHPGYGTTDLYLSRKTHDGWTSAENLGYPINTIDDEGSLIVASDGKTGYYASDRSDSKGGLDLYTFELRKEIQALKTLWVKGKVFDQKTKQGLPSLVELTQLDNNVTLSRLQTDEEGNYLVTLPAGKDYAFNVERKGYVFSSENFSLATATLDSPMVVDIPLYPIEAGASVILKNIFFDVKQTELKPASVAELNRVVSLLKSNPALKIRITGHTDNVGKPEDNKLLSLNRAKAVTDYLTSRGIDGSRLSAEGAGESRPIVSNETEKGKSLNRRTEMNIISSN